MKRKILIGVGIGVVAAFIIVFLIVGLFLGKIIKVGMETIGPKVTQTSLTVETVNVSILTGSGGVNDLILGNPTGFQTTNAISVGKAFVSVAPLSVFADKVIVKSVEVRDPIITFEGNPIGANNLKTILNNVNAFTGGSQTGTNAPAQTASTKAGKKLQVDEFVITGAKVIFNGKTLALPNIEISHLGEGPDGITPAELIHEVLDRVTTAAIKAVVSDEGAMKNIGKKVNNIGKSIGGLFKK